MDGYDDLFNANPEAYFDSVAGPLLTDVVGPPLDVLDTFTDGTPIAEAQSQVASGVGGGVHRHFWQRGDVQSFALMLAGGALIHAYLRAD